MGMVRARGTGQGARRSIGMAAAMGETRCRVPPGCAPVLAQGRAHVRIKGGRARARVEAFAPVYTGVTATYSV
jgi:hypothetical protein